MIVAFRKCFWPDINTPAGMKAGMIGGAIAALILALDQLLVLEMVVRTGQTLNNDAIGPDTQYIVSATIVCMYVFIAWRIWRRQGAIAAFLLLVLAIPGPLRNVFALAFGTFNLMDAAVSFLVFLLAINGFRGTSAHRKLLMAEGKVKPRPQPPWVKR